VKDRPYNRRMTRKLSNVATPRPLKPGDQVELLFQYGHIIPGTVGKVLDISSGKDGHLQIVFFADDLQSEGAVHLAIPVSALAKI
jgi:hypothetical protein